MLRPIPLAFVVVLVLLHLQLRSSHAQQQQPSGKDQPDFQPVQPESPIISRRRRVACSAFRTLEGTCTNPTSETRKLWGSTNRAQFSYFGSLSSTTPSGKGLKSAREISNILFRSCDDVFDPRRLSEMSTFFGQFIDHNVVATPADKKEPFNINVPANDPVFGNSTVTPCQSNCKIDPKPLSKGQLPFFRSMRVRVEKSNPEERPQNSLPSALDLVAVYGPSKSRNTRLRTGRDGLLRTIVVRGAEFMPFNTFKFNNAPDSTNKKFFFAGDHRANEHPVLTALHTIFVREHNDLAAELKDKFPEWGERLLFETARQINVAQFQKIVFKDWYPAVTGKQLRKFKRFNKKLDLSVSVVFSTAAFRVGHTMVGNQINRRGVKNKPLSPIAFCNMFFNLGKFFTKKGLLESVMRGAFYNRAQKVDLQVRDALRNFLFENVKGPEEGFDLVAMNLQRSRDHAVPSYNTVRARFRGGKAQTFADINSNPNIASALATAYARVDDVEAWPGMLAEELAPGSSLTPTLLAIWENEFTRLRDGDSFYYENGKQFEDELMDKVARVRELFDDSVDTFRGLVLRQTRIGESELPAEMFRAIG